MGNEVLILVIRQEYYSGILLHLSLKRISGLYKGPYLSLSPPQLSYPTFKETNLKGIWYNFGCRKEKESLK
jgi:hypothetical protein